MTPAEHLAEAERLLGNARDGSLSMTDSGVAAIAAIAQAHILAAIAVELGAPHPPAGQGGSDGQS